MEAKDLYKKFINVDVSIKCTDGTVFVGKTLSIDGYLNTALQQAELYEFGVDTPIQLATAFVRGSNVEFISNKSKI